MCDTAVIMNSETDMNVLFFNDLRFDLAGVAGFEPAHADTKNRCLTAWLHPSKGPRAGAGGAHSLLAKLAPGLNV